MLKLYILFLGVIIFMSCSHTGRQVKYYENGNVKEEYFIKNNKKNGLYRVYYKNGNIKEQHIFNQNKKIDSSLIYYKGFPNIIKEKTKYYDNDTMEVSTYFTNGKLYNFGKVLSNGNKIGWWKLYTFDNMLEGELEYINYNGSEFLNRTMCFSENKDSLINNYYSLIVNKDTIEVGEQLNIRIFLDEPFFSYYSKTYVVKAKNIAQELTNTFSNLKNIELDTIRSINKDSNVILHEPFSSNDNEDINMMFAFAYVYSTPGVKNIRGVIVEMEDIDSLQPLESKDLSRHLFFDKKIIVTPATASTK